MLLTDIAGWHIVAPPKGGLEEFGFSGRMCVPSGKHPAVTPAKKILHTHIKRGSSFELAVQGVDVSMVATRGLRTALLRTSVEP